MPENNKPTSIKPTVNPLFGPGETELAINPLTRLPVEAPKRMDRREQAHFQTTMDQVPDLQHVKDLGDYTEYGVSMFPQLEHNWKTEQAQNQSGWEHALGFLNQGVVGEVVGGMIEGFGWLGEYNTWANISKGEEEEVGNFLIDIGEGIQDWTKEATPIYEDPNASAWNPASSAWWASKGTSVLSFASMLIPAAGAVKAIGVVGKGLGMLAKAAKLAKGLGKLGKVGKALKGVQMSAKGSRMLKLAGKGMAQAVVSRHIENNMEASGVFKEQYDKFISAGLDDKEAKKLAGEAAQDTYVRNWAMLAQDIPQYMLMGSKVKLGGFAEKALTKAAGATAAKALTNKYLVTGLSEGLEESFQFWVGEEAKYLTDVKAGIAKESSHGERMKKYLKNGELWTSFFFGAFGGMAMEGAGPGIKKVTEGATERLSTMPAKGLHHLGASISAIARKTGRNLFYSDAIKAADESGDKEASTYLRKKWNIDTAIDHLDQDTFAGYMEDIENFSETSKEDKEEFAEKHGLDPQQLLDLQTNYASYIKDAGQAKEIYDGYKNDGYAEATLAPMVMRAMDAQIASDLSIQASEQIVNKSATRGKESLTPGSGEAVYSASIEVRRIKEALKVYSKEAKNKGTGKARQERVSKRVKELTSELKDAEKVLVEANAIERTASEKRADARVIKRALSERGLFKAYNTKEYNDMLTEEAQDEIDHLQGDAIQNEHKYTTDVNELINAKDRGEHNQVVDKIREKYGEAIPEPIAKAIAGTSKMMQLREMQSSEKKQANANEKGIAEKREEIKNETDLTKAVMDADGMRKDMGEEGASALETEQVTSTVSTKQNIEGATRASDAVAASNTNDENPGSAEPTTNSVPLPKVTKSMKDSMLSFNWTSARNGGSTDSANQVLTDLLEDPKFKAVGTKLELVVEGDGIRAILLNADGEWITTNDNPVGPLLHMPIDQKDNPNFTSGKRAELGALIAQVREASEKGLRVFTEITKRTGGHKQLGLEPISIREIETATGAPAKLMVSLGTSLMYHNGNPVTDTDATGTGGAIYLETRDIEGNLVPMKLDASYLTREEANLMVDLYTDFQNRNTWFNTPVADNPMVEGLTYGQAFELLAYEGSKTANTIITDEESEDYGKRKDLYYNKNTKSLHFGAKAIPIDKINEVREDIVDWMMAMVPRYASIKKLNLPMSEWATRDGRTSTAKFSFMGKDYTVKDKYNDFLIDSEKYLTNLSPNDGKLFIQPTIEFSSTLDIEEETAQEPVVPTPEQTKEAGGDTKEAKAPDNPFGGVKRKKTGFNLMAAPSGGYTIANMAEERAWLEAVLPNVPVTVIDGLIRMANKGGRAYGAYVNGMIQLSNIMEKGTAYHEAFHAVSQLYLSENERTELYEEARSKYGTPTQEQLDARKVESEQDWFEEKLADDFRAFVHSEGTMSFHPKAKSFFGKLWEMIKHLFGSRSKVDQVFAKINRGYYATAPMSGRVAKMTNKALYNRADNLNVSQFYDIVDTITFSVVQESKLMETEDISALTMEAISTDAISGHLATYYDLAMEANNLTTANIFIAANADVDAIRSAILDKFNEMQLEVNPEVQAILDTDDLTEEEKTEKLNTKSAFEYSGKDNATGNVKLLLSMVPKLKSTDLIEQEDGSVVKDYEINPNTGLPRLAYAASTWAALAKSLSGIVDSYIYETGELTTAFDKMLVAMDELTTTRPEISILTAKLRDPAYPMHKKIQFFSAFSKANMQYYTARFKKEGQIKQFVFSKSESRSPAEQVRNEWVQNFRDKMYAYSGDHMALDSEPLTFAYSLMVSLKEDVLEAIQARKELNVEVPVEEYKEQLFQSLNSVGIELSRPAFNYWMEGRPGNNEDQRLKNAVTKVAIMFESPTGLTKVITDGAEGKKPWVKSEKTALALAEVESLFREDLSESGVLGADNSMYYTYSLNNFLIKKIQEIKNNDEYLEKLSKIPGNANAIWISELLNNKKTREEFNYNVFNNLREEAAGDTGSKFSDLKPADELALRINQTLQGRYSLLTAADKGVYTTITGFAPKKLELDFRGDDIIFNNVSTVDIIGNYFIDELARMSQAWNEVHGPNAIPVEQQVEHYHKGKRHAFKSQLFPSLSPIEITESGEVVDNIDLDVDTLELIKTYITSDNNKPTWGTKTVNQLRPKVEGLLKRLAEKEIDLAVQTGVLQKQGGNLINVGLDTSVLKTFRKKGATDTQAIKSMMADYMVNSLIAHVETGKLFTGDPAYYKSLDDLKKRVPGIIAPGQDLFIHPAENGRERQFYNVAIVKDIEENMAVTQPEVYKGYKDALIESGMSESEAEEALSPYREINVADAQAYVTMERYKDLLQMLGKWRPSMEAPFDRLSKGEEVVAEDVSLFLQPLKGMYYDLVPSPTGNRMQPVYLKYSLAPLIPGMIRGTKMQGVLAAMKRDKVQELVFESGIKVGARGQVDIKDADLKFNPIELDNRNWKLQQDLSAKYLKKGEAIEGSQVLKNALANINPSAMYGDKEGAQLIEEFVAADRYLSDLGAESLKKEFGVTLDEKGGIVSIDKKKLYPVLIKELKAEAPKYVLEALDRGVALDAIPQFRKKIQQKLLSMVTARTVRLKMPGGSFVQMSPAMFEAITGSDIYKESDILWLTDGTALLPPRIEDGISKPGQVLVPHSLVNKYPGFMDMTKAEQIKLLRQAQKEGLLEGVGYRIPNQDMASTDYLEVAGVLPAYMGDTIIAYSAITAKTGSDYDIDKMYFMLPNFDLKINKRAMRKDFLENNKGLFDTLREEAQIKDMDNSTLFKSIQEQSRSGLDLTETEQALVKAWKDMNKEDYVSGITKTPSSLDNKRSAQNYKLDRYKEILLAKETFTRLISPIDAEWLKNDTKKIRELLGQETKLGDLEFFSGYEQYVTKRKFAGGQHGVGQTANHLVDHVLTQMAGVFLTRNFGLGHGYGDATSVAETKELDGSRYITSNVSAYMNAYVDIAKDPYIFDLNNNTFTANTVFLLIRMGVKPEWINRFTTQPIIKEYTDLTLNSEGRVNETQYDDGKPIKPIDIIKQMEKYAVKEVIPFSNDSMPSKKTLEAQLKDPTAATQRQLLSLFLELQEYAKALNLQLRASKADTKGAGRTLMEAFIAQNVKLEALASPLIENVDRKFDSTMLGTYYDNSVLLSLQAFGGEFMGMSKAVQGTVEKIGTMTGKFPVTDLEIATLIENEAYTYLMKDFPLFQHENPRSLFFGNTSTARALEALQKGEDSPVKENLLIRNLQVNRGEGLDPDFIDIAGSSKKDKQGQEALSEAWYDLITHPDEVISNFGKELITYAFQTTGLNQTASAFFDLMPPRFLEEHKFKEYVSGMNSVVQETAGGVGYLDNFAGRFLRNNWANNKLVPVASDMAKQSVNNYPESIAFRIHEKSSNYVVGLDENGRKVFYPYLKTKASLFRLQGYKDTLKGRTAIYSRATKRGLDAGRYKIKDYNKRPMDLDDTLGVQLIEGQDYTTKYMPPMEPFTEDETQEQRFSSMAAETMSGLHTKIELVQGLFDADFVLDETLPGVANVKPGTTGRPLITINPIKMKEDTVIHEVGHIYIDSLGGMGDPFIRAGVEQLNGSVAEQIVTKNYPNMTGEAKSKEVLATAIGMESAKLFNAEVHKKGKWNRWLVGLWSKVKAMFGIKPNVAKQMAREILTDRIRKGEHSLSEYTQEQRDEAAQDNMDDLDAVQSLLNRLKASMRLKINIHEKKTEAAHSKETKELREAHLAKLEELLGQIEKAQNYEGLLLFIEKAQKDTDAIRKRLDNFLETKEPIPLQSLQEMKTYIGTYDNIQDIRRAIHRVKDFDLSTVDERLDTIERNLSRVNLSYELIAKDNLVDSMLPYSTRNEHMEFRTKYAEEFQTNIEPQEKKKGKELKNWKARRAAYINNRVAENKAEIKTAEREYLYQLIEESKADLTYFDSHILDPRAVNNQVIQLTVKALDRADYDSMRSFQNAFKSVYTTWEKFMEGKKAKGITDIKAIYAPLLTKETTYVGGKKEKKEVSVYIEKHDYTSFMRAEAVASRKANMDKNKHDEIIDAFYAENATLVDGSWVPNDKYLSKEYQALSPENKEMLDALRKVNAKADNLLPVGSQLKNRLPSIRASLMETFKTSGFKAAIKEWRKETFTTESDETDFGNMSIQKETKKKFAFLWANEKLEQSKLIPIFFRSELTEKEQSFDLMGMAMSNYYMASNFHNKSKVSANIEVLRDLIKASRVGETKDWKRKMVAGLGLGNLIPITKPGGESNLSKALESLVDDRLYGIREIDAGSVKILGKEMSLNKISKLVAGWTADTTLILNYASASSNLVMGHVQTFIEAGAKTFYDRGDVKKAFGKYRKDIKDILGDVGKEEHIYKAKTNLLMERFDMRGEFSGLINSMLSDTKMKRLFSKQTAHGLNGLAEHNIQGVLMYSLLNNIRVQNAKGEYLTKDGTTKEFADAMSLDEAYTVVDGKLVMDSRVAKTTKDLSGTSFGQAEESEISGYLKYINADLNGNYDSNNRSVWQRHVLGQQAFLMKKWIPRAFKRRWGGIQHAFTDRADMEEHQRNYNEYIKMESEGLYATLLRYMGNTVKAAKEHKFKAFSLEWEKLDDMQKANLARVQWEFGMLALGAFGSMLIAGLAGGDDDKDKKSQGIYFVAYLFRRLYSELSFFTDPVEMLKMADTPLMGLRTIANLFKAFYGLMPWNITDTYKGGKDKDDLKIWNKFSKTMPIRTAMGQLDRDFEKSYHFLLRGY